MKERFLVLKPRSRFEVNKQDTNGNAWRALVASQIALARSRLSDLNPCSNARARSCFSIPLRTQRHPQPQPPSELGLHRGWPPIRAADLCRLDAEAMLQAVATDGWDVTVRHLFAPAPTCAHDHFGHADEGRQDVMCMLEGKCTLMLMKDNIWACSRESQVAARARVQSCGLNLQAGSVARQQAAAVGLRTGVGGAHGHLLALGVPHHRDQRPVVVVDHVLARRLELREGLPIPTQHLHNT